MAKHENPFEKYVDTNMDIFEVIRQMRAMIAEEYEAANLYEQFADVIDDYEIKEAVLDIANEEKIHAGEFAGIIQYIEEVYNIDESDKSDGKLFLKGMDESAENLN